MKSSVALSLSLVLLGGSSYAQAPNPGASPDPDSKHSGAPLGQFTAGPFIVTPTFRIGHLAVDTNVRYQRERRADFLASAGPGLDIALPFLDHWKFDVQGTSQYLYFHRTKELRRWTGGGTATLYWATTGTRASLSTAENRDFSRPSFEVDTRVASTRSSVVGTLERDLGRLTLALSPSFSRNKVDQGQEFGGADLSTNLTTDQYNIHPEVRYRLTPLSSLLFESSYRTTQFPDAPVRNFHQESAGVGVQTDGFFKGRVTAGLRRSQLSEGIGTRTQAYLRGDLSQNLGRRLSLREMYTQESSVSAFAPDGSLPTIERKALTLNLGIEITRRIDLRLSGTREVLKSDGLVEVILEDGTKSTARRDDVAYVTQASLGIRLGRARLGLFVSYTTRESLYFSDFGIQGLMAGARVEYAP